MEGIQLFKNSEFGTIRTGGTSEEPLFCLADVCKALGLRTGDVRIRLDKGVVSTQPLATTGGVQKVTFVNEDGLYDVILDSRKPQAKAFRKWLTSEVIPSIRKNGGYLASTESDTPEMIMARALKVADETIKRHEERMKELERLFHQQSEQLEAKDTQIAELNTAVSEMQDKVSYLDLIMQSKEHLTATQIGQDYGMSAVAFNRMLASFKVQRKVNNVWVVYAPYITEEYVTSNTIQRKHADGKPYFIQHTVWTQKGRAFLYQQLKKKGVLPTIERHS